MNTIGKIIGLRTGWIYYKCRACGALAAAEYANYDLDKIKSLVTVIRMHKCPNLAEGEIPIFEAYKISPNPPEDSLKFCRIVPLEKASDYTEDIEF